MKCRIKDGKLLECIAEPGDTEIVIPPDVEVIGKGALNCRGYRRIVIPDTVREVEVGGVVGSDWPDAVSISISTGTILHECSFEGVYDPLYLRGDSIPEDYLLSYFSIWSTHDGDWPEAITSVGSVCAPHIPFQDMIVQKTCESTGMDCMECVEDQHILDGFTTAYRDYPDDIAKDYLAYISSHDSFKFLYFDDCPYGGYDEFIRYFQEKGMLPTKE